MIHLFGKIAVKYDFILIEEFLNIFIVFIAFIEHILENLAGQIVLISLSINVFKFIACAYEIGFHLQNGNVVLNDIEIAFVLFELSHDGIVVEFVNEPAALNEIIVLNLLILDETHEIAILCFNEFNEF